MLPVLEFWKEDGDETQPMVYLVKKISERANAYARSSAKDAVLHALVAAQLMIPGVCYPTGSPTRVSRSLTSVADHDKRCLTTHYG